MRHRQQPSFFVQHPWMTFFLGLAAVSGIVTVVRGYDPALGVGTARSRFPWER